MGKRKTNGLLGNNDIEDVRWLCSLSESELDLLLALKMLAMRRAKIIGHPSLAKEFDLKRLRHLSFTMMEHLKEQLKEAGPESTEGSKLLDECNLSSLHVNDSFSSMSLEELQEYICREKTAQEKDRSSTIAEKSCNDGTPKKRRRAATKGLSKSCENETPTKRRRVAKNRSCEDETATKMHRVTKKGSCEDRTPRKKHTAAKKGSSKSCKDRSHLCRSCKNRTPT